MSIQSWCMWIFPLLFFALQFVARLFPGLIMPEIMTKFAVDATSFGFFASLYYLGYAGMQIPCAWLLDRFGIKKIISLFTIICGFSCLLSILNDNWITMLFSRFMIGASSAAGFLGVSKTISLWFAKKYYARMVGLSFTFGLMGALYGGYPVSIMIEQFGWINVTYILGGLLITLGIIIFIFIKNPQNNENNTQVPIKNILKDILGNKLILSIAFANLLMVGSLEGFADIWGISYLVQTRNILKSEASAITSFIFFGMLFGGPILAGIAGYFNNYYKVTAITGIIMSLIFIVVLTYNCYLSNFVLCMLMFFTGILCCYQVLVFAIGSTIVTPEKMGITIAFLNSVNMLGGTFFHAVIGSVMDLMWDGKTVNAVKIYSNYTFSVALFTIPVCAIIGSLVFWYNDKYKQN
ncbi:MAG: MFS transporter [Legionellales bacterium]|nr:MFS transporter [Legionellales bacterium]